MERQANRGDQSILWRCSPLLEQQRAHRSGDDMTEHEAAPCQEQDEEIEEIEERYWRGDADEDDDTDDETDDEEPDPRQ